MNHCEQLHNAFYRYQYYYYYYYYYYYHCTRSTLDRYVQVRWCGTAVQLYVRLE